MGTGHSHAKAPASTAAGKHKSRLAMALGLTTAFMAAEVVGGLWTGSLALLADAAHMLTDAGGTWSLLKQAVHILLEGTPPEVDLKLLEAKLAALPGVVAVDDLHVWTITS